MNNENLYFTGKLIGANFLVVSMFVAGFYTIIICYFTVYR
jgi:hypothetical protein